MLSGSRWALPPVSMHERIGEQSATCATAFAARRPPTRGVTAAATTAVLATGAPMTPTLPTRDGLSGISSLLARELMLDPIFPPPVSRSRAWPRGLAWQRIRECLPDGLPQLGGRVSHVEADILTGGGGAGRPKGIHALFGPRRARAPWLRMDPDDAMALPFPGQPGHGRTASVRRQPVRIVDWLGRRMGTRERELLWAAGSGLTAAITSRTG